MSYEIDKHSQQNPTGKSPWFPCKAKIASYTHFYMGAEAKL